MGLRAYWTALTRSLGASLAASSSGYGSMISYGEDEWDSPIDYGTYIRSSASVYIAARYRSKQLAAVPIRLYRVSAQGKRTEVTSGELFDLLQQVNPFWTARRLYEMTELSLSLWGSAYWFLDRGAGSEGRPREIWWANPSKVKVIPHANAYISSFEYDPGNGRPIRFTREETVWLRYPNPNDELAGLSPLTAAILAADTGTAAMTSNRRMFSQGMQLAGFVAPPKGESWTKEEGQQIEDSLKRRFSGANKAHRWAVLAKEIQFSPLTVTPKDAEYLGALEWSFEEICRVYGLSPDLLGGKRTYQNAAEARLAFWNDTMKPECAFIADELTEQLLPLFPGQADIVEFDLSTIDVLREMEESKWKMEREQIKDGATLLNEWRAAKGLDPVPWGDVWWAPTAGGGVGPVRSNVPPIAPGQQVQFGGLTINELRTSQGFPPVPWGDLWWAPSGLQPVDDDAIATSDQPSPDALSANEPCMLGPGARRVARADYGSAEHERVWRAFVTRAEPHERAVAETTADLFRRQRRSVLARLRNQRGKPTRDVAEAAGNPFDRPKWVKQFRTTIRPVFTSIVEDIGQAAIDELGLGIAFDVSDPNVTNLLLRQSQRFAREVNETTWEALKASLAEGVDAGEGIDELAQRVEHVMSDRIRSSGETIARTEVTAASSAGSLESWRQTGIVAGSEWWSALDDRVRDSHVSAHGQRRKLGGSFRVGGATGPGPGQMSSAAESVNCRCVLVPITDIDWDGEKG